MDHRTKLVMALVAFFYASSSHAGFAQTKPPAGWGGSPGAWTFNPAANGGNWVNGKTLAETVLDVGGKSVKMPAQMRFASNAAAFATNYIRFNPWLFAGGLAAGWLLDNHDLWWDPMLEKWMKKTSILPGAKEYGTEARQCTAGNLGYLYSTKTGYAQWTYTYCADARYAGVGSKCGGPDLPAPWKPKVTVSVNTTCGSATVWTMIDTVPPEQRNDQRDATPEDWIPPSTDPDWPPYVGDEVGKHSPMPSGLPSINPDPAGNPQTQRIPLGSPEPVPGSDPALERQPAVDIEPAPSTDQPWRVDVKPKDVTGPVDSLSNDPSIVPNGPPQPGTPQAQTPEMKQLCEVYPDVLACASLDQIPDVDLETKDQKITFEQASGFGASDASCPAPRTFTVTGMQFSIPFNQYCDFARGLRPVIIAAAFLSAALIVIGGAKS